MKPKTKSLMMVPMVLILGAFWSCNVRSVPLNVLVPADISLDRQIENVGIINHSRPQGRDRIPRLVEGFLTRESLFADQVGADFCLKGLSETLADSPRFVPVVIHGEHLTRNPDKGSMARRLSWSTVRRICQKYRVDALISLEHFDSDIYLERNKRIRKKKKNQDGSPSIRYSVNLAIHVSSGWRIYHPDRQQIIDADIYKDSKHWHRSGNSMKEALKRLPDKRMAINEAGYFSGKRYAERISPTWVTLSRIYYTGGCEAFEEAQRHIRTGNWKRAVDIWKTVLSNPDPELRAKATYNLAIAAEVRGELIRAYELAKKAYTEYGLQKAYYYMDDLKLRLSEEKELEEQLDH